MNEAITLVLVAAGLASLAVCRNARPLAVRLGVVDVPDGARKAHRRRTPLVGGIAVCLPLIAVLAATVGDGGSPYAVVTAMVAGCFALGFHDDRRPTPASVRLAACLAMALIGLALAPELRVASLRFEGVGLTLSLGGWALLFTLVSLVGLTNAVNMADGQNGLVIGLALIWSGLIATAAPAPLLPPLLVTIIGLVVALPFNLRGRLFLGDAGTYGLSTFLGLAAIIVYRAGGIDAGAVMMLFLVPVIDCLRLLAVRWITRRAPFAADRNHLHHKLGALLPAPWALSSYWALVGLPAALAVAVPEAAPLALAAALGGYAVVLWRGRQTRAAATPLVGALGAGDRRPS